MAELDKTEFTFPDEVEENKSRAGSKVVETEPEVEVEKFLEEVEQTIIKLKE